MVVRRDYNAYFFRYQKAINGRRRQLSGDFGSQNLESGGTHSSPYGICISLCKKRFVAAATKIPEFS